jgi:hypothetical protein
MGYTEIAHAQQLRGIPLQCLEHMNWPSFWMLSFHIEGAGSMLGFRQFQRE